MRRMYTHLSCSPYKHQSNRTGISPDSCAWVRANAIFVMFRGPTAKWSVEWRGARASERRRMRKRGDAGMERRRVRKREQSFHGLLPLLIWQAPGSADISAGSGGTRHTKNLGGRRGEKEGQDQRATLTVETNLKTDRGTDQSKLCLCTVTWRKKKSEFMPSTHGSFLRNKIGARPENWKPSQPFTPAGMNVAFCILLLTWWGQTFCSLKCDDGHFS